MKKGKRLWALISALSLAALFCTLPGQEEPPSYTIGNYVWYDLDGDGIQDSDEEGFSDVIVNLYIETVNREGFELAATTRTDINGLYVFPERISERYFLEFIPPEGWAFSPRDASESDARDSDPDPQTGRTDPFSLFDHNTDWDAGLVAVDPGGSAFETPTPTAAPTSPPTPTRTPTVSPSLTPSQTATLDLAQFDDDLTDELVCDTQGAVTDPEVDIENIKAFLNRETATMTFEVKLLRPLEGDFSFAVLLFVIAGDGTTLAYLWELHDGIYRVGPMDPATGQILTPPASATPGEDGSLTSADGLAIHHDRGGGVVSFTIPRAALPPVVDFVAARSFHLGSPQGTRNCDDAGAYTLPDAMRVFP